MKHSILDTEFTPGLVLFLDPNTLEAKDALHICSDAERIGHLQDRPCHYFVLIQEYKSGHYWLPLSSRNPKSDPRQMIPHNSKVGHDHFLRTESFVIGWQWWWFTPSIARSAAGHDWSSKHNRNSVRHYPFPTPPFQWWRS